MGESVRINKYLSAAGVCSRREADRQIEAGNVTINGRTAMMGDRVSAGDVVMYGREKVSKEEEQILIVVNKPVGIVCTAEKREKDNIVDFINYPKRIYPIGRLDKTSHGLLLMTNQGDLVNKMMRSGNYHEKEYIVKVNREITEEFLQNMAKGVYLQELDINQAVSCAKGGQKSFSYYFNTGVKSPNSQNVRDVSVSCGRFEARAYHEYTVGRPERGRLS